jgi:hypothetical protein
MAVSSKVRAYMAAALSFFMVYAFWPSFEGEALEAETSLMS